MQELVDKFKNWYLGLPWWGKVLGVLAGIALVLLIVLTFLAKLLPSQPDRTGSDAAHTSTVNTAIEGNERLDALLEVRIAELEKDIEDVEEKEAKVAVARVKAHEAVNEAKSFEEVKAIIEKEMGR